MRQCLSIELVTKCLHKSSLLHNVQLFQIIESFHCILQEILKVTFNGLQWTKSTMNVLNIFNVGDSNKILMFRILRYRLKLE